MDYFAPYRKFADFTGTATRQEYWMFVLFQVVIAFVLGILGGSRTGPAIFLLYFFVTLIPALAVTVRRLHDTGKSGLWIFVSLVPFVGSFILLFFMLQPSSSRGRYFETGNQSYVQRAVQEQNMPTNGADLGLVNFIKKSRDAGKTDEDIRATLKNNKWTDENIDLAMASIAGHIVSETILQVTPPVVQEPPRERKVMKQEDWVRVGVGIVVIVAMIVLMVLFGL